ncbi:MAG: DUF1974 domain-containing protein, partial [Proteobacteria bacterium]|nr:DUF1974 domain-containing protein [Pseudomonadota bacterium]
IFGQGAFMAHPYVLEEMKAGREENMEKAGELAIKHVGSIFSNAVAGVTLGLTNGRFASVPKIDSEKLKGPDVRFYQHINRLAHAFAYTSNIAMLTLQSSLMRKERISALLGDTASHLYIASQVLRRWHTEGRRREDKPLMQWAAAYCLHRAEGALWELTANFPAPLKLMTRPVSFPRSMMPMMYGAAWWASEVNLPEEFKAVSRPALMALGAGSILSSGKRPLSPPSHNLDKRVAYAISAKGEVRDHLTAGMFVPKGKENYLARLESALELAEKALPHEKKLRKLAKTNAKLNDKMPSILQSIADEVYKVHKKANREFKNVALHELKRAVKGEVFEGHLPDIHHLDVPEIWNKMKEIVRLTFREKSGPAQCSKMAHTALEEMGESIKKAQPERNSYEVGRLVTRAKDIMDRIITRAAVAQRDILTEAVDDGMRLASGGRLIERDMRRQAAIAIAQRIADKKEHNHDSFSQAAAAVLPKFVDSNTLTQSENYLNMIAEARKKRFITADIAKQLEEMYVVRSDIEQVNHYGADYTGPAEHPVPYVEPKPEPSPDPFGVRQITAKPAKPRMPR